MILEGIVTSLDEEGNANIAPMGPIVDDSMRELLLRPYRSSTTFKNLARTKQGVFHVVDDVELIARAAVGCLEPQPEMFDAEVVEGKILAGACRWYSFRVTLIDDSRERTEMVCKVVDRGRIRDFIGFNRAKHAVLEAAILATRVKFLDPAQIRAEMLRLALPIEKTAGPQERRAFEFLEAYMNSAMATRPG